MLIVLKALAHVHALFKMFDTDSLKQWQNMYTGIPLQILLYFQKNCWFDKLNKNLTTCVNQALN